MDVLEGVEGDPAARHAADCASCAARLSEAREALALARAAVVPDPPGLFWQSFPRQVSRRIDAEPAGRPWAAWLTGGLATAVAVGAAFVFLVRPPVGRDDSPVPSPMARTLPAWTPLPAAGEEAALPVVQALGQELDPALECAAMAECLVELSDEESQDLIQALRPAVEESRL